MREDGVLICVSKQLFLGSRFQESGVLMCTRVADAYSAGGVFTISYNMWKEGMHCDSTYWKVQDFTFLRIKREERGVCWAVD